MIIDGHAHACGELTAAKSIVRALEQNGIDAVVLTPAGRTPKGGYPLPAFSRLLPRQDLVAWANPVVGLLSSLSRAAQQLKEGNRQVAQLAQALPQRVIQCYWVQLSEEGWFEQLTSCYQAWGFRMLKLHQCWESFEIGGAAFDQLACWGAEQGLPLFVHARTSGEVQKLLDYATRHPQVTLINAHLLGLEACLRRAPLPTNLYFDVSAPQLVSELRLAQAVAQLGAGQVLFGSDLPFGKNNQQINLQRIARLPLSDEDKERILGGTLRQLLGL